MDAHYRSFNSLWYCWGFFALFAILAYAACLKYALKCAWPHFIALCWAERIRMFMSKAFQKAQSLIAEKISNFWLVPSARDFYLFYPAYLGASLRLSEYTNTDCMAHTNRWPSTIGEAVSDAVLRRTEKRAVFMLMLNFKFQNSADTNSVKNILFPIHRSILQILNDTANIYFFKAP